MENQCLNHCLALCLLVTHIAVIWHISDKIFLIQMPSPLQCQELEFDILFSWR